MSMLAQYFIADSDETAESFASAGPGEAGWRTVPGPDPSVALTALATLATGVGFEDYLAEDDFCGLVAQDGEHVVITISRAVTDAIAGIKVGASAAVIAQWAAADESLESADPAELGEFIAGYQELAGEGYANQVYAWLQL